jgi:hypothetical protein
MVPRQKQEWAKKHASRIQHRFEEWQRPLGIDGREYLKYLTQELTQCCDEPLRKSLIESIS